MPRGQYSLRWLLLATGLVGVGLAAASYWPQETAGLACGFLPAFAALIVLRWVISRFDGRHN